MILAQLHRDRAQREREREREQDHPQQFPPFYYWPGPYDNSRHQQGPSVYIMAHPQLLQPPKLQRPKSCSNNDKEESEESPKNAEPIIEDVNSTNKLFCVSDGYENDEHINKTVIYLFIFFF